MPSTVIEKTSRTTAYMWGFGIPFLPDIQQFAALVGLFSWHTTSSVVPQGNVCFLDEMLQNHDTVLRGRKPIRMNPHTP
jgi:hypothetical protein